jgi:hypothetical protein
MINIFNCVSGVRIKNSLQTLILTIATWCWWTTMNAASATINQTVWWRIVSGIAVALAKTVAHLHNQNVQNVKICYRLFIDTNQALQINSLSHIICYGELHNFVWIFEPNFHQGVPFLGCVNTFVFHDEVYSFKVLNASWGHYDYLQLHGLQRIKTLISKQKLVNAFLWWSLENRIFLSLHTN